MKQDLAMQDVAALIKARNTLLWIISPEELRPERALLGVAQSLERSLFYWDYADGVTDARGKSIAGDTVDPGKALDWVKNNPEKAVYVFRDLHKFTDPRTVRKLRSLAKQLQGVDRDEARAIVVLTPSSEVPPDLVGQTKVITWPLPDRPEMVVILDQTIKSVGELLSTQPTDDEREAIIDAAIGLTAQDAQNAFSYSVVTTRTIDPAIVSAEKKRVIAREGVLEWYDPEPGGLDAIGGLDLLKNWLQLHKLAFSPKARERKVPAPKGVLLAGISGTGKSLTAKCIGTAWNQPLLRLDMGSLKSKYVGDSEANIRKALRVAEAVSPCILWIDEIEKALGGGTGADGASDGGVSQDYVGTILNWMQERGGSVFVVATANDISGMAKTNPELLRKGRFDELFFIDLPTEAERRQVLTAALRKHGQDAETVLKAKSPVDAFIRSSNGWVGAEIEAAVRDALFVAFADGERDLTAQDVLAVSRDTVPLSKTAKGTIKALQDWAKGGVRLASSPEAGTAGKDRVIEV